MSSNTSRIRELNSLSGQIPAKEISMDLTEAGLLVERSEAVADLFSKTLDWSETKDKWHNQRIGGRGSRHSAQKIFRIIRRRFQAAGNSLPTIPQLSTLYKKCDKKRDKAQLTYLYLVNADPLVRFTLHELLGNQGLEGSEWNLDHDRVNTYLKEFRLEDGSKLNYADSTLKRWVQGFRSVLHDIGVRDSPLSDQGHSPALSRIPLLVSAGYAWKEEGEQWQERPIGWMYLFQPEHYWDDLFTRVSEEEAWTTRHARNKLLLRPSQDPFNLEGGSQ